jgi:ABC-type transport system involved in cytochrome bd biosynthesis fused ATPase/permease subunit
LFGIIILLIIVNPKALFFSLLIILTIGLIFFSIFKNKLKFYGSLIENGETEMFSVLNYSFSAVKELKIFNLNDFVQEIFEKSNHLLSDLKILKKLETVESKLIYKK